MNRDSIKIILCNLLLFSFYTAVLAQQSAIEILEIKFQQEEDALAGLRAQRGETNARLEQQKTEMATLQAEKNLGFLKRTRLENLMQQSLDLSTELDAIEREIRETEKRFAETGKTLLGLYIEALNQTLAKLESGDTSPVLRQQLLEQVTSLRQKKQEMLSRLGLQHPQDLQVGALRISPTDSPTQVRHKADLLKDQEDKYRKLAEELKGQSKNLGRELELRYRIEDLVADLALFDQQEEAIGELDPQSVSAAADELNSIGEVAGAVDRAARDLASSRFINQKDFDYSRLSGEELEQAIEALERRQQIAESKADSLRNRAQQFYRAAEDLKKK